MSFLLTLVTALAVTTAAPAEIPAGTHLLLRMEHTVTSRTAKAGDGVHLRTVTPVSANGKIVIPVGSYVQGVVTHARRPGRIQGKAELGIQIVTVVLPSGGVLKVSPKASSLGPEQGAQPVQRGTMPVSPLPGLGGSPSGGLLGVTLSGGLGGAVLGGIAGARKGARIGMAGGIVAALIPAILARGKDADLNRGTELDVVFEQPAVIE